MICMLEQHNDDDLYFLMRPDKELSIEDIERRDNLIEKIEGHYDMIVGVCPSNSKYASIINDLTLSLSMWIDGYPFDDDHKAKQREMIDNACVMIGKPRTIEELAEMIRDDL